MHVHRKLEELLEAGSRSELEGRLLSFLTARRWFRSKSRPAARLSIEHAYALAEGELAVVTVRVSFGEGGGAEDYVVPLAWVGGDAGARLAQGHPHLVVAAVTVDDDDRPRWLIDAMGEPNALSRLLAFVGAQGQVSDGSSALTARLLGRDPARLDGAPRPVETEQTNSSVVYGRACILKLLRKLDPGSSLELEMGEFLAAVAFDRVPALLGAIEMNDGAEDPRTVAVVHAFAPNRGDAFGATVARIRGWSRATSEGAETGLAFVSRIGERIAGMHRALASRPSEERFALAPIDRVEREALAERLTASLVRTLEIAERRADTLPADARGLLRRCRGSVAAFSAVSARFVELGEGSVKMRIHGDLHLGQMLVVDSAPGDPVTDPGDVLIVDFEGEPARSLAERRAKRSPLVDVAGVLRSLDYAAMACTVAVPDALPAGPQVESWRRRAASALLGAYLRGAGPHLPLPEGGPALAALMHFYLLEKCVYEMLYEMDNRPAWASVPLSGLLRLLEVRDDS